MEKADSLINEMKEVKVYFKCSNLFVNNYYYMVILKAKPEGSLLKIVP
jgi:hypothetical protein